MPGKATHLDPMPSPLLDITALAYNGSSACSPPECSEEVFPGVWKCSWGQPEVITPARVRLSAPNEDGFGYLPRPPFGVPLDLAEVGFRVHGRGCSLSLPYSGDEGIFGFGLQLKSQLHAGKKRHLRVNADATVDTGDSHAPVPFYVSTRGYGVLVDTARYASVYVGTHAPLPKISERVAAKTERVPLAVEEIYRAQAFGESVVFDIPVARGATVYLFSGPTMLLALQRYNLFSGGGVLPPLAELGNWYRACSNHDASDVLGLAEEFEREDLPFQVMGLEPGWHTHFYPNSFVWSHRFPEPGAFAAALRERGLRLNLWENAFIHPEAPFADEILPFCADQLSTDGLVPDFLSGEAREIFANHHEGLIECGVDGFKLDECDNGDFLPFAWSFPEFTQFPSGADGEQMHCLLGVLYQQVLHEVFERRGRRHYGLVRSSGALAAGLPYVLYSDLYDHTDFLRGTANAAFSGLLWTPEVRHADSLEDLVRRVQAVVLSPMSLINAWYIPNPPWKQTDRQKNEAGEFMEEREEAQRLVRDALKLRLRLLPYIYTAFAEYSRSGKPPFRAIALDHPEEKTAWRYDLQYLIGEDLIAAPWIVGETSKDIYLPQGDWWDFFTGTPIEGGRAHHIENRGLDSIPLFVRDGAIIPLAKVAARIEQSTVFEIEPCIYSKSEASGRLCADDGESLDYKQGDQTWIDLHWNAERGLYHAPLTGWIARRYRFLQPRLLVG